jgi:hypothetical protein
MFLQFCNEFSMLHNMDSKHEGPVYQMLQFYTSIFIIILWFLFNVLHTTLDMMNKETGIISSTGFPDFVHCLSISVTNSRNPVIKYISIHNFIICEIYDVSNIHLLYTCTPLAFQTSGFATTIWQLSTKLCRCMLLPYSSLRDSHLIVPTTLTTRLTRT